MIVATHVTVFADDPVAARAFFRDVLGMANVDAGGGWLIFKLPPAELGIHPAGEASPGGHHEVFLMCDDIDQTVADLIAKGAEFAGPVSEARFGRIARLRIPGGGEIGLYQPSHPMAYGLEA
jgi:predicted enzyme related to lactoylglutathione lyase